MWVSADGRLLYISETTSISAIDIETRSVVKQFPGMVRATISPDGSLVALHGGSTLQLVSAEDFTVKYQDSVNSMPGAFTADGKRLYYCGAESDSLGLRTSFVGVLNIGDQFESYRIHLPAGARLGELRQVLPSPDESRLYLYEQRGDCPAYFVAYDLSSDSTIFVGEVDPGYGGMIMANDGRYIVCTNAAPALTWVSDAYPELLVYDAQNSFALTKITTADCPSLDSALTSFNAGTKTPDGRWLLVGGSTDPHILVIDMPKMEVVDCIEVGNRHRFCFAAQVGI